jgi:hypothetical protein
MIEAGVPAASTVRNAVERGRGDSLHADVPAMPRIPLQYREAAAAYVRDLSRVAWQTQPPGTARHGAME